MIQSFKNMPEMAAVAPIHATPQALQNQMTARPTGFHEWTAGIDDLSAVPCSPSSTQLTNDGISFGKVKG